ncbi:MAG: uracil-DNA glycosylase [Rubrivivax sp.]
MRLTEPLGSLIDRIDNDWAPLLQAWRASDEGRALINQVDARRKAGAVIYPHDVFRALRLTPLASVRVLILGQDPYHGAEQAEGLAFSVPAGQRPPPSLRNIFIELQRDLVFDLPASGSLLAWAERGVLLLNSSLTVEAGVPASHSHFGWEVLTDRIVSAVAEHSTPKVFMLWGAYAQRKARLVTAAGEPHLLLQCNHPSPLSARRGATPFIGCGHFRRAVDFLAAGADAGSVDWRLPTQLPAGPGRSESEAKVV